MALVMGTNFTEEPLQATECLLDFRRPIISNNNDDNNNNNNNNILLLLSIIINSFIVINIYSFSM